MRRAVIDASVAVKLFFEEEHSDAAERVFRQARQLLAPDLIWAEAANVIWKRRRRGEIPADDAVEMAGQLLALPVRVHPAAELLVDALTLAVQADCTVYDALYLALAVRTGSPLVTADKRLAASLAGTPLADHLRWIGDA